MGFPRQENRSGLPFPSPEDLPGPGIEPKSPALADRFFTASHQGNPILLYTNEITCKLFPDGFVFVFLLYLIDTNAANYQCAVLKFIFLRFSSQHRSTLVNRHFGACFLD